jgi:hypothetical protein
MSMRERICTLEVRSFVRSALESRVERENGEKARRCRCVAGARHGTPAKGSSPLAREGRLGPDTMRGSRRQKGMYKSVAKDGEGLSPRAGTWFLCRCRVPRHVSRVRGGSIHVETRWGEKTLHYP